jgi:hypothetical protein
MKLLNSYSIFLEFSSFPVQTSASKVVELGCEGQEGTQAKIFSPSDYLKL